jgi:hypothetical protein
MFVYWPSFDRLVRIKRGRHACILIYLILIHTLTRLPDSGVHIWVGATCGINTRKKALSSTLPSTSKWKRELKMLKTLLSLSACLALVAATPFRDCGKCSFPLFKVKVYYICCIMHAGSTSTVTEFRVPGCNTLPCVIVRGTNVTIEVDFSSSKFFNPFEVWT